MKLQAICLLFLSWTQLAFANPISDKFEIPPMEQSFYQYGETREAALDPNNIKVLVWNIYKADKKSFSSDMKKIGLGQDVLLIQEAETNQKMLNVLELFDGYQFNLGVSFVTKKTGDATGTMIGSRAEIRNFSILRTKDLEPIVETPKVVTTATFPIQGMDEELLVLNIHGLNMTENSAFIRQLLDCEKVIQKHKGPVIFAGDFNTSDIDKYNAMMNVAFRQGLFTVGFRNDKRRKSTFSRLIIDHTFVRGLKIKDADIPDLKGSDHMAMRLKLAVE
ncbi:MAG: endonuclease/exonuclease/phosphatase family protein [Bdellovibrio sp.]